MSADEKFPGFTARLRARIIEVGYVRVSDGGPDVARLAADLKTSSANAHRWLNGMLPTKWLAKLAAQLETTQEYLLFAGGERRADGTRPAINLGPLHFLVPEDVLTNPKHQVLWRRLAIIWRNREKDPDLFDIIDKQMAHWTKQLGGEAADVTPAAKRGKKG